MDYLVYAYLQNGRDKDALEVIQQSKDMPNLNLHDFKIGYAATAMPIRYVVERSQWSNATAIVPPKDAPPHVIAIAVWARGLGLAHEGHPAEAREQIHRLQQLEQQLHASDNSYWATQVEVLRREVMAWSAQAENKPQEAATLMREAADMEDAIEKLPVTPGPILPAREQLGSLLLEQSNPNQALKEFERDLADAPGRYAAMQGSAHATELIRRK
jgi:hypothetical protein